MSANNDIVQMRRIAFIKYDPKTKKPTEPLVINEAEIGQGTVLNLNIAPRKKTRTTQIGTTTAPMPGTYESLEASITFVAGTFRRIFEVLGMWNPATFAGATKDDGSATFGVNNSSCGSQEYIMVVLQGVCDNASGSDVVLARCLPSLNDGFDIGTSDDMEITLALNPQIYNPAEHADDGYPQFDVHFGHNMLDKMMRLNVGTGEYTEVAAPSGE